MNFDQTEPNKTVIKTYLKRLYQMRFGRFLLVGGAATGLQYILLILFAELTPLPHVYCSAMGYAGSAIFNYLANYYFTFQATGDHSTASARFAATVVIGLALNTIAFYLAQQLFPHYIFSQIVATGVTLSSNYLLHKHWTYR
ncbi:GtrA family protein [Gilvimarinus sp. SDUM040013]|uniref:GtrA family protein n=1 Tax=Gilvimarinus gilvus TaxID=3058038 RepID=A0ABU4RT79_9GAMM|nr:GtrA family protein [Gilvimarinus sp. SDUM040013]MDO3387011.1 GtrA family protein [Gilvimarinus sp. SDUM040013]MDX6848095.1 GtrA family protein [Gilvimarinus sp. SDUM040013]